MNMYNLRVELKARVYDYGVCFDNQSYKIVYISMHMQSDRMICLIRRLIC